MADSDRRPKTWCISRWRKLISKPSFSMRILTKRSWSGKEDWPILLKKSLYGSKEAPMLWSKTLKADFEPLAADGCVYFCGWKYEASILIVYVDDVIYASNKKWSPKPFVDYMTIIFDILNLPPTQFLWLNMDVTDSQTKSPNIHFTKIWIFNLFLFILKIIISFFSHLSQVTPF